MGNLSLACRYSSVAELLLPAAPVEPLAAADTGAIWLGGGGGAGEAGEAANRTLLGGGGVDGAIHRAAGPLLRKECATLGGCETGEAKITGAYGLPAKYVIHTVGPIVHGAVSDRDRKALQDCYLNSLKTAVEKKLRTVAFPCISTGVYGYPPEEAVEMALATVREYLDEHHEQLDRVIFCVFLGSDDDLYRRALPLYFPQDEAQSAGKSQSPSCEKQVPL
ncbi:hypothetical protein ACEWY4_026900 [Coilia grayii]|uniref:Macro domain-containing protein n=1 Tax=Coilia grayii TaxID=363190 RepID=A0ABD1IQW1_9TELE